MRFGWRHVSLIDFDRCFGESGFGIAALALQSLFRSVSRSDLVWVIIGFKIGFDVRRLLVVGNAHDIRSSFGRLESVRHGKGNVLTVITNHIVLEWRASLDANAFEALTRSRTG